MSVVEVLFKGRLHKNWRIHTGGRVLGAGFWEETSLARSPSIPICIFATIAVLLLILKHKFGPCAALVVGLHMD